MLLSDEIYSQHTSGVRVWIRKEGDKCIDLNSEPEKSYLAKRTIVSLLS